MEVTIEFLQNEYQSLLSQAQNYSAEANNNTTMAVKAQGAAEVLLQLIKKMEEKEKVPDNEQPVELVDKGEEEKK